MSFQYDIKALASASAAMEDLLVHMKEDTGAIRQWPAQFRQELFEGIQSSIDAYGRTTAALMQIDRYIALNAIRDSLPAKKRAMAMAQLRDMLDDGACYVVVPDEPASPAPSRRVGKTLGVRRHRPSRLRM